MAEVPPELIAALESSIEVHAELRAILWAGKPRPKGILSRQMYATVAYDRALQGAIDRRAEELCAEMGGEKTHA